MLNLSPRRKPTTVMPSRSPACDGEAGGRRDGAGDGDAGHGRLLDDLEADPARDEKHAVSQRRLAGQKAMPDDLVDGVVAADVLA